MASRPVVVVDGVVTNLSGGAQYAVSPSGSLAYVSGGGGEGERSLVWVDRNGRKSASIALRGMRPLFDLSPDGARVARYNAAGPTRDVWIEELASGASTQITFDGEPVSTAVQVPLDRLNAVWSPDGNSIVYAAGVPASNLFRVSSKGPAAQDSRGFAIGTPDRDGELRAKRTGTGAGRVYTLTYEAIDHAGNTARCAATVTVPHDQGNR